MLVLSRRVGEAVCIGDSVVVTVVGFHGRNRVELGFVADTPLAIDRKEIRLRPDYHGRTLPGKEATP